MYDEKMRDEGTGHYQSGETLHALPPTAPVESDFLRRLPVFEGVAPEIARQLIRNSSVRQYRAGSIIVTQGEAVEGLHVVQRGIVDLTHISGDHECGVLLLSAKDLLMPSAALFRERALVSARALTNARLLEIGADPLDEALSQSRAFATNLMKAMSGQWRMAVRNIVDLNCRTAAQRLAAFLLRIADLQPQSETAVLPIPKRHLAIRLGMTAETLSRMLQVVASHGLYLRGRTIIVRDRAEIVKFCGPDLYSRSDERSLDVFAL